jgi:hypothetical protein
MVGLRLRWPKLLRDRIAAEAEKAGRSINSEILHRLGLTLDQRWQEIISETEREEREDQQLWERANKRYETDPEYRKSVAKMLAQMETGRKKPKDR